jgi:hypothetical protein
MSSAVSFIASEFDIFAPKPIQSAVLETTDTICKPLASLNQDDLEFVIPDDSGTYIDLDIKLFVKGRLEKADGAALDNTDFTAGTNNFLHSLFSQCRIKLNGKQITHATDLYNYRAYLETLLNYGSDATS